MILSKESLAALTEAQSRLNTAQSQMQEATAEANYWIAKAKEARSVDELADCDRHYRVAIERWVSAYHKFYEAHRPIWTCLSGEAPN
jgi:hypothetical protein